MEKRVHVSAWPETAVEVGTFVKPDGWSIGDKLESGLEGFCDFYLPTWGHGPIKQVAVNVRVTGRFPHRRAGDLYRRVSITFVGDGEPNEKSGGWILFYQPKEA